MSVNYLKAASNSSFAFSYSPSFERTKPLLKVFRAFSWYELACLNAAYDS
jgi:hypothetical protein